MSLIKRIPAALGTIAASLREQFARGFRRRPEPIVDRAGFRRFLHTRSAQRPYSRPRETCYGRSHDAGRTDRRAPELRHV